MFNHLPYFILLSVKFSFSPITVNLSICVCVVTGLLVCEGDVAMSLSSSFGLRMGERK